MATIQFVPVNAKGGKREQDKFINVPPIDVITEQKRDENGDPLFRDENQTNPVMVNRQIRYSKGESSIYVEEQMEGAKPSAILLQGPLLIVNDTNTPNLAEYLQKTNYNATNENRRTDVNPIIKEYNAAKMYEKALDIEDKKIDAIVRAQQMDFDELKAFLIVTSKRANMAKRYNRMSPQEIRHEAYRLARTKPDVFLKGISDELSKIKIVLVKAISAGIIKNDEKSNELLWESGNPIMRSPRGISVVDEFCEKIMNSDEYKEYFETIKAKLNGMHNRSEATREVEAVSHGDRYDSVIDEAVKKGLVEKAGKFFTYDDEEYEGYEAFKEALKEDGRRIYNELLDLLED
jgi:hypothetical protein